MKDYEPTYPATQIPDRQELIDIQVQRIAALERELAKAKDSVGHWHRVFEQEETGHKKTAAELAEAKALDKVTLDSYGSKLAEVTAEAMSLRDALTKARDRFEEYTRRHFSKGTHDGNEKAESNSKMALMCENALATPRAGHLRQHDLALAERAWRQACRWAFSSEGFDPEESAQIREGFEQSAIRASLGKEVA